MKLPMTMEGMTAHGELKYVELLHTFQMSSNNFVNDSDYLEIIENVGNWFISDQSLTPLD